LQQPNSENIAEAYLAAGITSSESPEDIAAEIDECYQGKWNSDSEFVQQLLEDCGDIPKDLPVYVYIDWEATARDVMMDYCEQDGYYFRNL
jgi:antirestriction protein